MILLLVLSILVLWTLFSTRKKNASVEHPMQQRVSYYCAPMRARMFQAPISHKTMAPFDAEKMRAYQWSQMSAHLISIYELDAQDARILDECRGRSENYILRYLITQPIRPLSRARILIHLIQSANSYELLQFYTQLIKVARSNRTVAPIVYDFILRSPTAPQRMVEEAQRNFEFDHNFELPFPVENIQEQIRLLQQYEQENKRQRRKTIYEHTQNVHDLCKSITTTSEQLIRDYPSQQHVFDCLQFARTTGSDVAKIQKAYETITENQSIFGAGFKIIDLFNSILSYIDHHPDLALELRARLAQEMIDMKGKCGTGHFGRLINVIQGYQSNYIVKMEPFEEIYARVRHYYDNLLKTAPEEVIDSLTATNKAPFYDFLQHHKKALVDTLVHEYNGVVDGQKVADHVEKSITNYSKI